MHNFLIGPVYSPGNTRTPMGVLQFFNKVTKKAPINQEDLDKFKTMAGLLGLCIETTNEMALTVGVRGDVSRVMDRIGLLEWGEEEGEGFGRLLGESMRNIREIYNKMVDDRTKAKGTI